MLLLLLLRGFSLLSLVVSSGLECEGSHTLGFTQLGQSSRLCLCGRSGIHASSLTLLFLEQNRQ